MKVIFANSILFISLFKNVYSSELNLKKHMTLSFKNNPTYIDILAERRKLKFVVDQGLPSRQLLLSVASENGYSSDSDQNTSVTSGELSKEIIETGTDLSVSKTKTVRPDRNEDVTQIRVGQSLYKNMFGRDVRLMKESLQEQKSLRELEIEELEENFLATTLKNYLELSKSYRDYTLSKQIHSESLRLKKNVESKFKSKIASGTDLNRTKLLVLIQQEGILDNKNVYESLKKQIEKTILYEFEKFEESDSTKLISSLEKINRELLNPAFENTRMARIAVYREAFTKKDVVLQDRVDSPDLSFVVGYNKDDSSRFSTVIKRDETVFGLKLDIPFGDTKAKANYQLANIELIKSQNQRIQDALTFKNQKTQIENRLVQAKNQMLIDDQKVNLTKMIIKDEEKRFSIGRIDLETLIELKSDYASYRSRQSQSRLSYGMALIDWLALNDRLDRELIAQKL